MLGKAVIATIGLFSQTPYAQDLRNFSLPLNLTSWEDQALNPTQLGWFKGQTYQAKTRQDKMIDLWGQVVANQTMAPYDWKNFDTLFSKDPDGSFCQNSDELQKWRKKTTHRQGVVAQVDYVPTPGQPFTGIYAQGTDTAILRLSQTTNLIESSKGLFPSIALKFLIDGRESSNLFAVPDFIGTESWDFFSKPMTNRVAPFDPVKNPIEVQTIQKKLA